MGGFLTALFGKNGRNTTISGIGAILVVVGSLMSTGEVPEGALALALGFLGVGQLAARDGGNGSDT